MRRNVNLGRDLMRFHALYLVKNTLCNADKIRENEERWKKDEKSIALSDQSITLSISLSDKPNKLKT